MGEITNKQLSPERHEYDENDFLREVEVDKERRLVMAEDSVKRAETEYF